MKANAALLAARAQTPYSLDGLKLAAEGYCGERWVAEVKRLTTLQDLDRRIADCNCLGRSQRWPLVWPSPNKPMPICSEALARSSKATRNLTERGALQMEHSVVAKGRCGPRLQQERQAERAVRTGTPAGWL